MRANTGSIDASDIYKWQSLAMVKNFITKSLWNNQGRNADDGGAEFYRKLSAGDGAYLVPLELRDWHLYFPMTLKGERKVSEALSLVKETYKPLTAPLLVNNGLPLPDGARPLPYLTFAKITEEDYPWNPEGKMVDIVERVRSEFGLPNLYEPLASSGRSGIALSPATPSPEISQFAARPARPQMGGTPHYLTVSITAKHRISNPSETRPTSGGSTTRQNRAKSYEARLPSSTRPKRSAAEAFGDENDEEEENDTPAAEPPSEEF